MFTAYVYSLPAVVVRGGRVEHLLIDAESHGAPHRRPLRASPLAARAG